MHSGQRSRGGTQHLRDFIDGVTFIDREGPADPRSIRVNLSDVTYFITSHCNGAVKVSLLRSVHLEWNAALFTCLRILKMKSQFKAQLGPKKLSIWQTRYRSLNPRVIVRATESAPEIPTVVPGTEILPGQGVSINASSSVDVEETRERLEGLKESLLSSPENLKKPGVEEQQSLSEVSNKAKELISDAIRSISREFEDVKSTLDATGTSARGDIEDAIVSLKGVLSQTISSVDRAYHEETASLLKMISEVNTSLLDQIPPEARESVSNGMMLIFYFHFGYVYLRKRIPFHSVIGFAVVVELEKYAKTMSHNPEGYGIAGLLILLVPSLLIWQAAYGGYSGSYKPQKAVEILQTSDALLVDVRKDSEREEKGVPTLKRGARGKGIALPLSPVPTTISRQLRNSNQVSLELLATQISSISKLGNETRVIIMDKKGENAKDVARAVRAAGVRNVYFINGGFEACRKDGLSMDPSAYYEDGPLALVADTAETLTEETKSVLSRPQNAAIVISSITGVTFFVANFHEILKYIGVLGIEATILIRFLTYDSPDDFFDDISTIRGTVSNVLQLPTNVLQMVNSRKAEGN